MSGNGQQKLQAVNELIRLVHGNQLVTVVAGLPQLVQRFERVYQNEEMAGVAADFEAFIRRELGAQGNLTPVLATLESRKMRFLKEMAMSRLAHAKAEAEAET